MTAPRIPHLVAEEVIGGGGFATVYRYRELDTERPVAVKVLTGQLSGEERTRQFRSETRLMAQLSTHPHIVTIYRSGVTDDGLPFLVMELCSRDDMAKRTRVQPLSVAEALRVGIQVAGALETAHRGGILHRDVKPANVLTTDYGKPALTDFGISAALDGAAAAEGLSIPWSPPEAIADPAGTTVVSDVWSLAATVWHLLRGHSPFAVPGGANDPASLIDRITHRRLPPTGRADVPDVLERLLAQAMAKNPADRPTSVLSFARGLQTVERTAGLGETTPEFETVRERERSVSTPVPGPVDDDPGTRIRQLVVVDPDGTGLSRPAPPPDPDEESGRTGLRPTARPGDDVERQWSATPVGEPPLERTALRSPAPTPEIPEAPTAAPRGRRRVVLAGVGVAVLVGAVGAAVGLGGGDEPSAPVAAGTGTAATGAPAVVSPVPSPTELVGARQDDGSVLFSWSSPEPLDGDSWLVRRTDPGADDPAALVDQPQVTVQGVATGAQACVAVSVRRSDGRTSSTPAEACAG